MGSRKDRKKKGTKAQSQPKGEETTREDISQSDRRRYNMDIAIYGLGILGALGLAAFGALYSSHKTAAIWTLFPTIVIFGLAFCLYWQQKVWEEEAAHRGASQTKVTGKVTQPTPSPLPSPEEDSAQKRPVPPSQQRPTGRGGLTFREVPPEEIGLPIPDTFVVDFGTNTSSFPRMLLEMQVPFERLIGIKFPGDLPRKIFFDKRGELKVDATVYDKNRNVVAVIKASGFAVLNASWDRNWDRTAFEIVDENRIPFFQIERRRPNLIKIRGVFRTSAGAILVGSDSGLVMNPTQPVAAPVPLFRYPSATNLHIRSLAPQ